MVASTFLKSKMAPCYVGSEVRIHLGSQEAYFKAMNLINGDLERIQIYGMEISWKQAFQLIYKSRCVKNGLFEFDLSEEDEYTAFFNATILLLKRRNIE
uniref:Uncharacterized protein n=1 Tax=Panagrellus redivivus TaxID=6233 RepID=A0A7E4UVH0_PANRE